MTDPIQTAKHQGHGDYERSDVSIAAILYFLIGLAIVCVLAYFVVEGLFWYLDKRAEATQTPVSPLVTSVPKDTRRIPPQYGNDYDKYLKEGFPAPQLETDERTELNGIRQREAETLSTYGWVDQKAGTVRIPIDRAMELLAQRGLPVRSQAVSSGPASTAQPMAASAGGTAAGGNKKNGASKTDSAGKKGHK